MSQLAYPVAADGHSALAQLRQGGAVCVAREKEAESVAGHRVAFVTQSIGPLYDSEAQALEAYRQVIEANPACVLTCRIKTPGSRKSRPVQPVFEEGVRWPKTRAPLESVWQLSVSYWKILAQAARPTGIALSDLPAQQARKLRKGAKGQSLTPEQVAALVDVPLAATRPQKALDFGLFDFIPPDQPEIVIADE